MEKQLDSLYSLSVADLRQEMLALGQLESLEIQRIKYHYAAKRQPILDAIRNKLRQHEQQ